MSSAKPFGAYARALRSCLKSHREAAARGEISGRAQAALGPQLFNLGAPSDELGFRRIGGPNTLRELNPAMQRRMQDVCYYLAVATPFGEGMIRVMTDYIVGEGFQLVAEEPQVQAVLDRFAKDPVNNLKANLKKWVREQLIFGELTLPLVENPVDGFVRVGYIDPSLVEAVEFGTLITPDRLKPVSLPVAVKLCDVPGEQGSRLRIAQSERVMAEPRQPADGVCFYFPINEAKSGTRGISELFALADWVDVLDQMVFDFADKVRFLNAFIWHYTAAGADATKVKEIEKEIRRRGIRQGGFWVTNEQVKIEAQTPQFHGAEMHEAARMVKTYGTGSKSLPPWMFGDPVDANRASSEVMEGPAGKMLTNKQDGVKTMVLAVGEYVLDRAQAHRQLPQGINRSFKVQAPDISVKDMQKISGTLQQGTNALAMMEDRGWVRGETAARVVHTLLSQLGVEIDSTKEFGLAQREKADRDAREIDSLAPQRELADTMERMKKMQPGTEMPQ